METLAILLMVLAVGGFVMQLTFLENKWIKLGWLATTGLFVYAIHFKAVDQSYNEFRDLLNNTNLMIDLVVLQVIEAIIGLLMSIFMIRHHYGERVKRYFTIGIYFPGVILFPALFYLESFVFLNTAGMDFETVGISLAVLFPILLGGLMYGTHVLIHEYELRIEMKFMMHLLQLIGGIILSILLNRLPVNSAEAEMLPTNILCILLAGIASIIAFGFAWRTFIPK